MKGKIVMELAGVPEGVLPEECCGGAGVSTSVELENIDGITRLMLVKIFIEDVVELRGLEKAMLPGMLMGIIPWPGESLKQHEQSSSIEMDASVFDFMKDYMDRKEGK